MSPSSSLSAEKKHWWVSHGKVVEKYVKEAGALIATQDPYRVSTALGLLDAALALSPRHEAALELRARSLLSLRRFRDVVEMLQGYIPSSRAAAAGAEVDDDDDDSPASLSSEGSSAASSSSRQLLPPSSAGERGRRAGGGLRCFPVSELKRRLLAGLRRKGDEEGQWRYTVLGQACGHLGMVEDAVALLQAAKRLSTVASRRHSRSLPDDSFPSPAAAAGPTEPESAACHQLLAHAKLLLRRRAAAIAALDAGLPAESARHFSKLLDGRRGPLPRAFAASCLVGRAAAHRAAGRAADAVADCDAALALEPASIPALRARAALLESLRALPGCLRDLGHLRLLYAAALRDGKLPGPPDPTGPRYRDLPGELRAVSSKVDELRRRQGCGGGEVDYYALIGVRRGCTRAELERAHRLLCLRHLPEKAAALADRVELADVDEVRDRARTSAAALRRLLQAGYAGIMAAVMDAEAAERHRPRGAAAAEEASGWVERKLPAARPSGGPVAPEKKAGAVSQGVLCRELAAVGNVFSRVGLNQAIQV